MLLGSTSVKAVGWMLMKLTAGVNFINTILESFMHVDPKIAKRFWQLDWIFTLLGSLCLKATPKHLVKSTLGDKNYVSYYDTARLAHVAGLEMHIGAV